MQRDGEVDFGRCVPFRGLIFQSDQREVSARGVPAPEQGLVFPMLAAELHPDGDALFGPGAVARGLVTDRFVVPRGVVAGVDLEYEIETFERFVDQA